MGLPHRGSVATEGSPGCSSRALLPLEAAPLCIPSEGGSGAAWFNRFVGFGGTCRAGGVAGLVHKVKPGVRAFVPSRSPRPFPFLSRAQGIWLPAGRCSEDSRVLGSSQRAAHFGEKMPKIRVTRPTACSPPCLHAGCLRAAWP